MEDAGQVRLAFRLPLDEIGCSVHFSPPPRTPLKVTTASATSSPSLLVLLPSRQGQLLHASLSGRSLLPVRSDVGAVQWLTSTLLVVLDRLTHDILLYRIIRIEESTDVRFVCTFHFTFSSLVTLLLQHGLHVKLEDALQLVMFHWGSSCLDVVIRCQYVVQLSVDERGKSMQVLACLRLGDGLTKGSFSGPDSSHSTLLFLPKKMIAFVMSAMRFDCLLKLPIGKVMVLAAESRSETSVALVGLTPDCRWLTVVTVKPFAIYRINVQRDILKTDENASNIFQHVHMSRLLDARWSSVKSTLRRPSNVGTSSRPMNALWQQEVADVVSKNNALQMSFELFQSKGDEGEEKAAGWSEVVVPEEYVPFLPKAVHCSNSEIYVVAHRDEVSTNLLLGVIKMYGNEAPFWMVFEEECHIDFPQTSSYPITLIYPLSLTIIAVNEQQGFQRELAQAAAPDPWNDLQPLDIMEMVLQQHHQQSSKDNIDKAVEYLQRRYPAMEEYKQSDYPATAAVTIASHYLTSQNYTQASQVLQWVNQSLSPVLEEMYQETINSPLRAWLRTSLEEHHMESSTLKEMEQYFQYLTLLEESVGDGERPGWNLLQVSAWSNEERRRRLLQAALKKGDADLVDRYSTEDQLWSYLIGVAEEDEADDRLCRWVSGVNHGDMTQRRIPDSFCQKAVMDIHDLVLRETVLNAFARRQVFSHKELHHWRSFLLRTISAFGDLPLVYLLQRLPPSLRTDFVGFALEYRLTPVLLEVISEDEVSEVLNDKYRWLRPFLKLREAVFVDGKSDGALALWCRESLHHLYGLSSGEAVVEELVMKGQQVNIWDLLGAIILFQKEVPIPSGTEVPAALMKLLQRYPALYQVVFSSLSDTSLDGHRRKRVTIYSALHKTTSCHYEVSQLFGWQSTQTLNTLHRLPEMPAFSSQALQEVYGYKKELDFVYYLKNARPSFAYWVFVAHLTASASAGNWKEEILAARDMAFYLAVAFVSNTAVTKACVAFTEMLDSDSLPLRISLQIAGHLKTTQKSSTEDSSMELYKYGGEVAGSFLESWLQRSSGSPVRDWDELVQRRLLVHQFVQLFRIKFSLNDIVSHEAFEKNDWLSFLLLCDLFQYSPAEVTSVLPHVFLHPHLRRNLRCILQMVKNGKRAGGGKEGESNKEARNVRSSLYQRIGMKSSAAAASDRTTSSASEDDRPAGMTRKERQLMVAPPSSMIAALSNSLHRSLLSWRTLLHLSTTLSSPIYAMMAASEPGAHHISVLAFLLYTSLSFDKQRQFHLSNPLPTSTDMEAGFHWTLHQHVEPLGLLFVPDDLPQLRVAFRLVAPHSIIDHLLTLASDVHQGVDNVAVSEQLRTVLSVLKARLNSSPSKSDNESLNDSMTEGEGSLESVQWGTAYGLRVLALMMCGLKQRNIRQWRQSLQLIKESGLLRFVAGEEAAAESHGEEGPVRSMMKDMVESLPSSSPSDVSRLEELKWLLQDLQRSSLWQSSLFRMEVWRSIARRIHVELRAEQSVTQVVKLLDEALELATSQSALMEQCLLTHILCKLDDSDTRFRQAWTGSLAYGQTRHQAGASLKQWMEELGKNDKHDSSANSIQTELLQLISTKVENLTNYTDNSAGVSDQFVQEVISHLLTEGQLCVALRLARVFGQHSADVDLLCWVLAVALQDRLPEGSCDTWPVSLRDAPDKKVSRAQGLAKTLEQSGNDKPVLQCLKKALDAAVATGPAIAAILYFYTLAKILSVPLDNILRFDALQIVDGLVTHPDVLQSDVTLQLARHCLLMTVQPSTAASLSAIVGQHMVTVARQLLVGRSSQDQGTTTFSLAQTLRPYWFLALDQSSLVNYLLDTVHSSMPSHNTDQVNGEPSNTLSLNVEILIIANHIINEVIHKPSMIANSTVTEPKRVPQQLIARLLEVSKVLSKSLASSGQFALLIRLLQGVGRYSDMTFVFHMIQQADQMELLFSRHVEKEPKLRMAILNYLRRFQPDDQAAFEMLAAAYSMHRDIAEMYWGTAQEKLLLFKHRPISDTKETQAELRAIVQYKMDVLSSFTRAHCHTRANEVLLQARLVALQIMFLPAGLRLLSLNNPSGFVATHPSFAEAFIYAQAYDIVDEWADALYHNYVVNSDIVYLQDFTVKFSVTTTLISKVASRYRMDTSKPPTAAIYMKKLLRLVKDIPVTYQLANELALHDLSMELMQTDHGSYLRDVMDMS